MPYHGAQAAFVATSETTASTTYTDLTTPGPAVTVTVGASGMVMVLIYGQLGNTNVGSQSFISFAASGANTQAASDGMALGVQIASSAGLGISAGATFLLTGLNPGSTTFTSKYRVTATTGNFSNRRITAIPLYLPRIPDDAPDKIPEGHAVCPLTKVVVAQETRGILPLALEHCLALREVYSKQKASFAPGTPEAEEAERNDAACKAFVNGSDGETAHRDG
jgi:hypothetical protein